MKDAMYHIPMTTNNTPTIRRRTAAMLAVEQHKTKSAPPMPATKKPTRTKIRGTGSDLFAEEAVSRDCGRGDVGAGVVMVVGDSVNCMKSGG